MAPYYRIIVSLYFCKRNVLLKDMDHRILRKTHGAMVQGDEKNPGQVVSNLIKHNFDNLNTY